METRVSFTVTGFTAGLTAGLTAGGVTAGACGAAGVGAAGDGAAGCSGAGDCGAGDCGAEAGGCTTGVPSGEKTASVPAFTVASPDRWPPYTSPTVVPVRGTCMSAVVDTCSLPSSRYALTRPAATSCAHCF